MNVSLILGMIATTEDARNLIHVLAQRYPDIIRSETQQLMYHPIPADAVQLIGEVYGYTVQEIAGPGRQGEGRTISSCRATVIDILNHPKIFAMGRPSIGERFLGGRDNSTVRYIQQRHFVWDLKYMAALHRVCLLLQVDYQTILAEMEQVHGEPIVSKA